MPSVNPLPSQGYLRSILEYDLFTGELTWKWRADVAYCVNRRFAGKRAGAVSKGYRVIRIDNVLYQEPRVIWKWVHGEEHPAIDHISHNTTDNRIWRLRPATLSQNSQNMLARGPWPKGVTFDKNRALFSAKLKHRGRTINLGRFETPEAAHAAYAAKAKELFGVFACLD